MDIQELRNVQEAIELISTVAQRQGQYSKVGAERITPRRRRRRVAEEAEGQSR